MLLNELIKAARQEDRKGRQKEGRKRGREEGREEGMEEGRLASKGSRGCQVKRICLFILRHLSHIFVCPESEH